MSQSVQVKRRLLGGHVLVYECLRCRTRLKSPINDVGMTDSCPECGVSFVVPGEEVRDEFRRNSETAKQLRDAQKGRSRRERNDKRDASRTTPTGSETTVGVVAASAIDLETPQLLRRCPYCAEEILAAASKCKHCGEFFAREADEPKLKVINKPPSYTVVRYLLYASLLIIFLIVVEWGGRNAPKAESYGVSPTGKIQMIKAAQRGVRAILKSPASADFPSAGFSTSEYSIQEISANRYRVRGYVDAQNSFGAHLRNDWEAICTGSGLDWYAETAALLP